MAKARACKGGRPWQCPTRAPCSRAGATRVGTHFVSPSDVSEASGKFDFLHLFIIIEIVVRLLFHNSSFTPGVEAAMFGDCCRMSVPSGGRDNLGMAKVLRLDLCWQQPVVVVVVKRV